MTVKKTRIPLPGESPKVAPKVTPAARKSSELSEETVVESDDTSDSESDSGASTASESEPEKRKSSKKPDVKKVKKTEIASPPVPSEESSEEESGSEDESGSKSANASGVTNGSESDSGSGSESSEESESESSEESSEEAASTTTRAANASTQRHTAQFRPAKPFEPPSGFKQAEPGLDPSSNLAKLLQSTDLSKNQIWHITMPAAIDIRQIKEFAVGKTMGKEAVVQHNGVDYAFVPEEKDAHRTMKLMIPSEKGYIFAPTENSETLHLQQIIRLPKLSQKRAESTRRSDAASSFVVRPEKPARPQPKGLRMRYKPSGYGDDEPGAMGLSGSEDGGASGQAHTKRKHGDFNGSAKSPTSTKKAKKEKRHKDKSDKGSKEDGAASSAQPMEGVELTGLSNGTQENGDTATPSRSQGSEKKKKKDKEKEKESHKDKRKK